MRLFWIITLLAGLAAAWPASAKDLTQQCQDMTFKAHPKSLPDIPSVVNLRSHFFQLCMDRQGVINPLYKQNSETGGGS
jgi:hypothetical protein